MKNRKMLLASLLSIALVFSLMLPASAAGASAAVPRPDDRSISHLAVDSPTVASAMVLNTSQAQATRMVAAGPEIQLAKWDLVESFENGGATGVNLTTAVYLVYQADLSDVEHGRADEIMEGVKGVIGRRIAALGITESVITIWEQGGEWNIAIQLPGASYSEKVKEVITLFAVLEFRELDAAGNWTPATGVVGNQTLTLSSRYFKENTHVTVNVIDNKPLLVFEWDETGAELSKQITTRLLGKQLAIFLSDNLITAPRVDSVVEDKGQIEGIASYDEALELSRLLNAGRIDVPLGRWVEEGQSKVFKRNVPLYEGQVPPIAGDVGIKAGDWIRIKYKITGWPAGQSHPKWVKLEFLSVVGTIATVQTTLHWSDGTEESDTVPLDLTEGGGEGFVLFRFVISANLTTGDPVYITILGNVADVAIQGETTRIYSGANRTVVYASISQSIPSQGEVQFTYYWDKQTGIIVEASVTSSGMTMTAKATETNMWEATTGGMPWWVWMIIAAAIGAVAFAVYRLKKRKTPTTPTPPAEGS